MWMKPNAAKATTTVAIPSYWLVNVAELSEGGGTLTRMKIHLQPVSHTTPAILPIPFVTRFGQRHSAAAKLPQILHSHMPKFHQRHQREMPHRRTVPPCTAAPVSCTTWRNRRQLQGTGRFLSHPKRSGQPRIPPCCGQCPSR